jgi:hypothetical protein
MPTAGRLAGAIIFGLFGWYFAGLTIPFFPESNAPDYWLPASAALSLFVGWRICGTRAGQGYNPAIGSGLTTAFAIGFCMIFMLGFNQMISNSLRLRYDGPMEAIVDVFSQMLEFSLLFYDVTLIVTLFVGGVVCAWVTEYFGQRFP